MPIREFICKDCGAVTEKLLLPREDTKSGIKCSACGQTNTETQLSAASFKFARGGFSASSVDLDSP